MPVTHDYEDIEFTVSKNKTKNIDINRFWYENNQENSQKTNLNHLNKLCTDTYAN